MSMEFHESNDEILFRKALRESIQPNRYLVNYDELVEKLISYNITSRRSIYDVIKEHFPYVIMANSHDPLDIHNLDMEFQDYFIWSWLGTVFLRNHEDYLELQLHA